MKYCSKCGNELMDEAVVCPKCGCSTDYEKIDLYNNKNQEEKNESNGMAVAGFVCSFFIPILGIIFSAIGLSKASKIDGKGKGLSIAGLVISIIWILICLLLWVDNNSSLF